MDIQLKNRLIEVGVDKFLIALLMLLATLLVNKSLDNYKLIQAQRVADTSEFVKACSDVWAKAYDYEDGLNNLNALKARLWFAKKIDKSALAELDGKISAQEKQNAGKLEAFNSAVRDRRYVLGEPLTRQFWQYIGFLKVRSDAQEAARNEPSQSGNAISSAMIEQMNLKLSELRFSANAAREHAVSKLP
jgi:hypothetical protein